MGDAVLLRRRLIMARKTWMSKSKLKRLKRMSWRKVGDEEAIRKKELRLVAAFQSALSKSKPEMTKCPQSRMSKGKQDPVRNRFAEEKAEDLEELLSELERATCS